MSENTILIYKLNTEGNIIEIDPTKLLDEFISVNIIFFYFWDEKHLYVWIGQNAGKEMRKYIPPAEEKILKSNDRVRILRHFTVDQNQESREFLEKIHLDKKDIKKRSDDYSKYRISVYQEIQDLQVEKGSNSMVGKFDDAIIKAREIIETAKKVNDADVIEEEERFIKEMEGNKAIAEKRKEASNKIASLTELLQSHIASKDPLEAHTVADEIRTLYTTLIKRAIPGTLKQLLFKEEKFYESFRHQQDEIKAKVNKFVHPIDQDIETQDFADAKEKFQQVFELLKDSKDETLIQEWQAKQKYLDEQKDSWEKEQEEIRKREEEIARKISELKAEITKAFEAKDYEQVQFYLAGLESVKEDTTKKDVLEQTQTYSSEIQEKLAHMLLIDTKVEKITTNLAESNQFANQKNYNESLAKLEATLELVTLPELEEYREKIESEILRVKGEKEVFQKRLQTFDKLTQTVVENQAKLQWNVAIQNCTKIIELAKDCDKLDEIPKYQAILDTVTEKYNRQKQLALEEQEALLQKAKAIENIIEVDEGVLPMVDDFAISDLLGDLDADVDNMMDQLGSLLETQRVEIKTDLSSKSVIRSASGEVLELNTTTNIKQDDSPANGDGHQKPISFSVESGLDNPFDDFIEEAIIEDIIPYNFEISEITLNGEIPIEKPEQILLKDGMQLHWVVKDIAPKESVKINYDLKRRVSRTIILPLEDQLKIIKTHTNVHQLHLEGLYDAQLKFANQFKSVLRGVVIEDIVPQFYVFEVKQPDNINPDSQLEQSAGSLVKWNITQLEQEHSMLHRYQLLEIFRFEDLKISIDQMSNAAFEELEKGKLGASLQKYSDLMKLLDEYK
ncbi:hypothetical protein NEF87_003151 [Candidatus Lokiarchaeum ossiferum]|uniref:Gelsolin-like domain-containing protein n=1 Tax=Candidatus Lokiarchaeum ossiferum TaxID=2951803 RepID=A0ABY6HTX3_9ARCH|nr:hypothetical protein NEF87_003151 [Candidatus Lokiarchaeum sp. B-35]